MRRALLVVWLSPALVGCGGVFFAAGGDKDRRTPLESAVQAADVKEVQRLLASGADPNDRGTVYGSPLNAAASRQHNVDVIKALIAAGANPNGRGEEGNTCWASPLLSAAAMGDLDNTRTLLDSGAAIPQLRCSHLVVGWLKPPVIDLLRQHGLDIFATDRLGRNELHIALAPPLVVPKFEGIEYLVNAGVPLNARDHSGKTPLAYWRQPRDIEIHWFRVWLIERLVDNTEFRQQRDNRAKISALLERSGAQL
jgi:ankyrin repeat protein